jgi:TRAP-type mannitol/chloroaromatic compound transport system substrate-binding protein
MKTAYQSAQKIYAIESAGNSDFKKIFDSMRAFQRVSDVWMGLTENTLANFMQSQLSAGK